jgi:hypothetical protein
MATNLDRNKTLQELEQFDWGQQTSESSVVSNCYRLRQKPIGQFTVEELRIMIGQQIGLAFLVPIAIEHLENDPFVEGDYFPGDLLEAVQRIDRSFWATNPEHHRRVREIVERAKRALD